MSVKSKCLLSAYKIHNSCPLLSCCPVISVIFSNRPMLLSVGCIYEYHEETNEILKRRQFGTKQVCARPVGPIHVYVFLCAVIINEAILCIIVCWMLR